MGIHAGAAIGAFHQGGGGLAGISTSLGTEETRHLGKQG